MFPAFGFLSSWSHSRTDFTGRARVGVSPSGLIQGSRIAASEISRLCTLSRQQFREFFTVLHFGAARCLMLKLA
jgi:hypothetical protein